MSLATTVPTTLSDSPIELAMDIETAIETARRYSDKLGLPWRSVVHCHRAAAHRADRRILIVIDTGHGASVCEVDGGGVIRLEFYPCSCSKLDMLPPWLAYPGYSSTTIGWRQGTGELYKRTWSSWYTKLGANERQAYIDRYGPGYVEDWAHFIPDTKPP